MTRRPAPVRLPAERDPTREIELQLAHLTEWRDGHEKRCEARAQEFRDTAIRTNGEIQGIRAEMRSLREDIVDAVKTPAPAAAPALTPPPLSEAEIARLVRDAVASAIPSRKRRDRIDAAKDWVQIVFQTVTGLGVLLWVAGHFLSWLGAQLEHLAGSFPKA